MLLQRVLRVLWPSFLVAGVAEFFFFALFDPRELTLFGEPLEASRQAIYTIGFFLFWGMGAASGALTAFLQRSSADVNRCPPPPTARPEGCPKREEPAGGGPETR